MSGLVGAGEVDIYKALYGEKYADYMNRDRDVNRSRNKIENADRDSSGQGSGGGPD